MAEIICTKIRQDLEVDGNCLGLALAWATGDRAQVDVNVLRSLSTASDLVKICRQSQINTALIVEEGVAWGWRFKKIMSLTAGIQLAKERELERHHEINIIMLRSLRQLYGLPGLAQGHWVAARRIGRKWELYDPLWPKVSRVHPQAHLPVISLLLRQVGQTYAIGIDQ